ncbi:MAG: site-2 protease family protein [Proteobacteria bacterium]|nr:site-2 protease family protein [Pseudomonadota bacterium]
MLDDINYWLVSTFVLPVLLGITLHEAAHGWVAWKLGDNTAYDKGRVSFNPFRHIDLFGTIVLPALLVFARAPFVFGWAKPVPVHFRNLHHPRRDMVLVAAAGPFANLLIAVGAGILLHFVAFIPSGGAEWIDRTLQNGIFVNLLLAVFNMLPVPPLDGGRVAVGLLPKAFARPLASLERYGFFILLAVMLGLPALFEALGREFSLFQSIILPVTDTLYNVVLTVTGHI